jgi:V-type H+-transporting ATPase subunit C
MFVNDKLLKLETSSESFLKRIDKQFLDLKEKQHHDWYVKGGDKEMPVNTYLYEYKWNDSKYPRSYPIPRIAENFEVKLNNYENELRQKTNSYNEVKVQLSQNTQKE